MGGRPPGAENKDKPFREALRMEVAAAGADHKKLRSIARSLLDKAEEGDIQAIKEIADRLDGKPAQGVQVSGDPEHPIVHAIRREIVSHPEHTDR